MTDDLECMQKLIKLKRFWYALLGLILSIAVLLWFWFVGSLTDKAAHLVGLLPWYSEVCGPVGLNCWTEIYDGPSSVIGLMIWGVVGMVAVSLTAVATRYLFVFLEKLGHEAVHLVSGK